MARIRSVDFLPEIFQTDANKQFLAATLDQLIQEPKFKKTQGFIGRTVGPGVNPNDKYVIEPTKTRADYQLEAGVISVDADDNTKIIDAITYPGINDALAYQGSPTAQPGRLYTSDYYSFDPFVDFDSFINFSQYYWVPNGPDPVDVQSTGIPLSNNFVVDRANGVYTFGGVNGNNPTIDLVRGGNYTFQVAQNTKQTVNYRVTRTNVTSFNINNEPNATITLVRGNTYVFNLFVQGDFPFWIKTSPVTGTIDTYNSGVTRNGSIVGSVTFTVPQDAPNTLYYACGTQSLMNGQFSIVDATAGSGPQFWIQTDPGISGTNPVTPNITSRSVFGVTNNGIDLGTVNFNVPQKTAQDFYYNLTSIGAVDLITGLQFDQINGARLDQFVAEYGGIDGITNLNTRTLVFTERTPGEDGGWIRTTPFDPLTQLTFSVSGNMVSSGSRITYSGITPTNVSSLGSGAVLDLTFSANSTMYTSTTTSITVINPGTGYAVGDTLTIPGTSLGGFTPANNLNLTVTAITGTSTTGLYDSLPFDLATPVPVDQYYNVWRINYLELAGYTYLQLTSIQTINPLEKFVISYGTEYSSTQWYKDSPGFLEEMPVLTAKLDTLYYQDSIDPAIFGRIRLLEQTDSSTIYIDDIIGHKNYTSPNGVVFTNGLKVQFLGNVSPAQYKTGSVALTCINTASGINLITTDSTQNLIVGQEIMFSGAVFGGIAANTTYYVQSIFSDSQFKISITKYSPALSLTSANGSMIATASQNPQYYVSGVGTAIELLPVSNFITPEIVTQQESLLGVIDYLTIDRASPDLNAWTRSNRWFHIDVLNATGAYNNTPVVLDNDYKAKRPILQFRSGIRLFNMGTEGKQPVNVIDFVETDALSNVEGSTGYTTNDYTLVNGSRVIFAADTDPSVRDKIYVVNFIEPDTTVLTDAVDLQVGLSYTIVTLGTTDWNDVAGTTGITYAVGDSVRVEATGTGTGTANFNQPIINLVEAVDGQVLVDQCTVCISGDQTGTTFWYDGIVWLEAQFKDTVQQAPLFDVYDPDGVSFSVRAKYPSSTFVGSKLFSYATGSATIDAVLQLPLRYLSLANVGDIVFDNNLYADTFVYVKDNVSFTENISLGFVREYATRAEYARLIGWQTAEVPTLIRQQFKFVYDTTPLRLDVAVLSSDITTVPPVKVYVGSVFQDPNTYSVAVTSNITTITFSTEHVVGDVIEVEVLSDQISSAAFYQVPMNLQNNPLNANSDYFTLGTLRTHYNSICQNLTSLTGTINGPNNTRDLGNIVPYGQVILQQSAPLTMAGYFMRSKEYNIFGALEYNSREYQKYKNRLMEAVTRQTIQFETTSQVLDTVMAEIILGRTSSSPFYWSDMLPATSVFTTTTYTISYITSDTFDTVQVYNYTSSNYLGMNVYLNDVLLIRDLDYVVATDGPRITVLTTLTLGDVLTLQEYSGTYGTYVPNTPSKMGLYPAWRPEIITVKTSSGTAEVILGHDGSQTPLFGDIRDQVLLEFEQRIYNNIKMDGNPVPLDLVDVLPGQFRETGYTSAEINTILETNFLNYVGWNKLDYTTQDYSNTNLFSYNYSQSKDKLTGQDLLGAWRGIYRYFYDTQQPEQAPWEMLGFSVRPDWWEITYGPAPYTRDNLNLWDDLEIGLVRDPLGNYILPAYARPGLAEVLPTNGLGELLPPLETVVSDYSVFTWQKSWAPGDGSPVEASWWNSSDYPFAVMRLLALTRPAKFFALFADRDLYKYSTEFDQYLYNGRYRLDANGVQVYGDGTSKASYINWIVDYNRLTGINSTVALETALSNLDVRLCYRMASFSDKQYIKIYTEKSSPNSTNNALLIPPESYQLLVYKNQPFDRSIYSSVVVQVVDGGWAVFGYSTARPYFNVLDSIPVGQFATYSVGTKTIQVPANYTQNVSQIPYGFVFTTESAVVNFLLGYGKYLERQGFTFTNQVNGYVLTWSQMSYEYLYWTQQGWGVGSLINLNPLADGLTVTKEQAVVDDINAQTVEHVILDQNRRDFPVRDLNIVRIDNTFKIQPLNTQSLSFIDMRYTSFESMIVLDNASLFGDLIYEPTTGARQSRLNLVATTTTEWNGSVDAQGFILNQNNIPNWTGLKIYSKGELVKYKGTYWSAATIVQPSATFNYNDWNQSDYTLIEQGLLANLANKADQLSNSYNINSANLIADNDLLSYGLTGFRPRQYMAALNLDDVSQLNIYREFIGTKGTKNSVDLLGQAKLNKEVADYKVYENWAIQRGVYGANANRSFFDLRLNRANLTSNPALVQIVVPGESSTADQQILLENVWKSSFALTTPNILPTTTTLPTDISLPTAGYVNVDDADITVFELANPASLNANLNTIINGTSIWVAKVNNYDWNIYRAQSISGQIQHICDNLNGTCRVIFNSQHGLSKGDQLIIRFFDVEINGVYRVLSVSNLNTVNVALTLTGGRTVVDGVGIGFTLKTMRVSQASDAINLPYVKNILPGAKVWVDDNGSGSWEVLKKTNPFTERAVLSPVLLDASEQYGAAVAQTLNRTALFVGSPRYGFGSGTAIGAVYLYVKNYSDQYAPISPIADQDTVLTLATTGVRGYGSSLDAGGQTYAVAGAPGSLGPSSEANNGYAVVLWRDPTAGASNTSPWVQNQLLVLPGTTNSSTPGAGEFGYSVAMSLDERWMYIGAPGLNTVYAYGQVQVQAQNYTYRSDGVTTTVTINDYIQADGNLQISVFVNDRPLTDTVDYNLTYNAIGVLAVVFVTAPAFDTRVVIQRNNAVGYTATGTFSYNIGDAIYTADNIFAFSVYVDSVLQRPYIDYILDGSGNVNFYNIPTVGAAISFTSNTYYKLSATIAPTGLDPADRFGSSVSCSTDGRQVIIGCANNWVGDLEQAGAVYVYDRNVQKFIRQDDSSDTYTVLGTVAAPVSVLVNNKFLVNTTDGVLGPNLTNEFLVVGNDVTIYNADLAVGDVIEIETNQFVLQQRITQDTPAEFVNFGQSLDLCPYNCSLYVGAPQDSTIVWKGGVVQRSVNQARTYGTITATIANPAMLAGQTLRVNNVDIAVPASDPTVTGLAAAINGGVPGNDTGAPNATAVVSATGYLTIYATNMDAAPVGNKLQVAPGSTDTDDSTVNLFDALGFETFVYTQTISSPYPVEFAAFGYAVAIDDTALNLVVGSPQGSLYLPVTFDYNTVTEEPGTTFDGNSTTFFDPVTQSGVVYTYDYLPSSQSSVSNPGKFIFGQQVENNLVRSLDQYGKSVSYNSGVLVAGAPGQDLDDSALSNYGAAFVFENPTRVAAWAPQYVQQPVVDIRLLTSVYMYDRLTSAKSAFFDFFDPLQGKILGAAQQNIDYISGLDPAGYNVGAVNNRGLTWGLEHIGEMWWDISTVRFIDPNQDNITYASRRWAQVFPGSSVDVYQWINSPVSPANYTGPGVPYSVNSYVINTRLNDTGSFVTEYYFWVRNLTVTASEQGKTLSTATVASYILDPKASGISYIAPINSSTIAIYNALDYVVAADTIISVEFDQTLTDANVHTEYELIAKGQPDAFLTDNLYRKLQDSFCGVDTFGNLVPDPNLNYAQRYGVQFRPRQSMFVDRYLALKNYIQRANSIFALYPMTENHSFALLNSAEPEPSAASGDWNLRVANLEILGFQNIYAVPLGYKYLVVTDSTNRGLWCIYNVQTSNIDPTVRELRLYRVQNYDTRNYWSYVNWYMPGYNSSSTILYQVPNYATLATLSAPVGTSAKVTANAQGKFEIYLFTDAGWERVGLEDGTIEISAEIYDYALGRFGFDVEVFDAQYFDQEPVIETRKIIQAINQELLIGDLLIERNLSLSLMFDFILSELLAPEWLIKTSLIDVQHKVRDLVPYQNYIRDNQDFVSDYIQEVKPYHVQVREFNLTYNGADDFQGSLTDFDLPAYYNTDLQVPQYTSPILLPYAHATAYAFNTLSDTPANSAVWTTWPYSQWYNNFSLELASVTMINPGTGYTIAPLVIIQAADGDSGTGAEAEAVLGPNGTIASVTVTNPGSGYRVTPNVVFDGGNGIAAQAYAVMQNDTVRSFRTVIKYDRYQYQTGVLTWSADGTYENGTLVRYDNRVWQANSADGSTAVVGPDFNLEDWTAIDAATLSGVNRTMGFYTPGVNEFGLDLGLLVDGTRYPGVQVWGDYFLGSAPISPTISCTASDSLTNSITCTQTVRLTVNDPIRFYGDVFGGVVAGSLYYINTIIDNVTFTISTTVNGSPFVLTTATGLMVADVPEPLDATYASSFTDQYLGLRPTDINVDGGEFIGLYEGHAPEELVNGSEYDTLDFRVYTRPGSDWTGRGHGFQEQGQNYIYEPGAGATISWANVVQNSVNIEVFNGSTGIALTPGVDYTTDWAAQTITMISNVTTGDTVNIAVYEMGGGNQLFRGNYTGDQVGNSVLIPVAATEIYELVLFVNGQYVTGATWSAYSESVDWTYQNTYAKQTIVLDTSTSIYYRAIQTVPQGILITNLAYWVVFTPTTQSLVEFPETYTATDGISLTAMGFEDPQYSWSTAQTQFTTVDSTILFTNTIPLVGSMQGTNPANIVVTRNGLRLQPPEGIEWEGDDSSTSFGLPQRGGGYSQADIDAYTDIQVWVDNVLQVQNYGSIVGDYYVTAYDGSNTPGRQVVFFTPPAAGANILISVSTIAQYRVAVGSPSHLLITPLLNLGDVIGVTSWNDTAQQNALTLVFVGPVVSGVTVIEGYDSTDFDAAAVSDTPGSFDYSAGAAIYVNDFDLGRNGLSANRLWVTLDGYKLSAGVDYSVSGQYLILSSGAIGPAQVVAVTEFTESIVPDAMAFRVFQDMRGLQTTYRITVATTTTLAQSVTATADIIYVVDASMLSEPNISTGIFGVVTINGERIMYRERNTATNTISSLLRGTAGTGAAAHSVDSEVYDMGLGNRLTQDDQDYIVSDTSIGDGSTTIFYAPNIEFDLSDSAFEIDSLEVYVGGNRARKGYQAGSFVTGETYTIASIGNTDWYAIGLPDDQYPAPGVVFTATGAGSGTGIAGTSLASHYYQEINYDPITVQFITANDLPAPASGVEVVILQRRGVTWYAPGVGTPSNGEPLQLTETAAARFLRGL